jgi:hypothetical protein
MAAFGLMGILALLVSLGCLICWIIVLIKQFQTAGALHGIIGIITCGIWTFIWGWMNANQLGIKNIMMIWTVLIIVSLVLRFAFGAGMMMYSATPSPASP